MKLSTAVQQFLKELEPTKAAATRAAYGSDLHRLVVLATPDSIMRFTDELVMAYFLGLSQQGIQMSTLHRKAAALSEFAKWGIRKDLWLKNPLDDPKYSFRKPDAVPRPFDPEEAKRLMDLELEPDERVLRALLYYTGLRVTPICQILVGHLSFAPMRISDDLVLPGSLRSVGKGSRVTIVPMDPDLKTLLVDHVQRHPDLRAHSWLLQDRGRPWSRKMVEARARGWGARAAVADCTPHRFRHTLASDLLRKNVDLRVIQMILGHADIKSTTVYTRVVDTSLAEAIFRRRSE